jgi:hypothetical protein
VGNRTINLDQVTDIMHGEVQGETSVAVYFMAPVSMDMNQIQLAEVVFVGKEADVFQEYIAQYTSQLTPAEAGS